MSSPQEPEQGRETLRVRFRRDGQGPDPYANWQEEARRAGEQAEQMRAEGKLHGACAAARHFVTMALGGAGLISDWTAAGYALLASLEEDRGDFAAALENRQAVLHIKETLHGADHPETAEARRAVAEVGPLAALPAEQQQQLGKAARLEYEHRRLLEQRRPVEAACLLQQALDIRQAVQGEDNRRHARLRVSLARV